LPRTLTFGLVGDLVYCKSRATTCPTCHELRQQKPTTQKPTTQKPTQKPNQNWWR